ncbi:MAG: PEP-CTERM sorting domain-containing protein, partial [Proteobacteria bacterium]|nr:PEP-CTERM sorting domain-containing protein [Pseudomonadota bacterium]
VAVAYGEGMGSGQVEVSATSAGVASGTGPVRADAEGISRGGGDVLVSAAASGASGLVSSTARTAGDRGLRVGASVHRGLFAASQVIATASMGSALSGLPGDALGTAQVVGRPSDELVAGARGRHEGLETLLTAEPDARVLVLGEVSALGEENDQLSLQTIDLALDPEPADVRSGIELAIFSESVLGAGFEQLAFRLEVFGEVLGEEQTFASVEEADAFFASLLSVPSDIVSPGGDSSIRAIFEISSLADQGITFGFAAVVVPEPSTGLLLGFGLALVVYRKRRA